MNILILFELVLAENVRNLYNIILENYNSLSPPVTGSLDLDRRTIIDVGVDLIWINEIDPAATKYDALIFWELTWHDDRLTWEGIYFKLHSLESNGDPRSNKRPGEWISHLKGPKSFQCKFHRATRQCYLDT